MIVVTMVMAMLLMMAIAMAMMAMLIMRRYDTNEKDSKGNVDGDKDDDGRRWQCR